MKACCMCTMQLILWSAIAVQGQPQHSTSHDNKAAGSSAWAELEANIRTMHVVMASVESSGNSDADFVRLMLPHHQAAIDMAKTQLVYGTDPRLRRLAQEIITDQQSEVELMQLWLKQQSSHALK